MVFEDVTNHQCAASTCRKLDEFFSVAYLQRQRFLHEHVLATDECLLGHFIMLNRGRRDYDALDLSIVQYILERRTGTDAVLGLGLIPCILAAIADHVKCAQLMHHADQVLTPVSGTNNSNIAIHLILLSTRKESGDGVHNRR